jgi:hypothetical protein
LRSSTVNCFAAQAAISRPEATLPRSAQSSHIRPTQLVLVRGDRAGGRTGDGRLGPSQTASTHEHRATSRLHRADGEDTIAKAGAGALIG